MFEELSESINRFAKGDLAVLEDAFHEMHKAHPNLSFPECVAAYEQEHGVKLNSLQANNALKGYER